MVSWFQLTAIAACGALGALCRYGLTIAVTQIPGGSSVLGTTFVNVLGCALLGAITAVGPAETEAAERLNLAIRVGFLGSLTTFSTLVAESSTLASSQRVGAASGYVLANLVIGWLVFGIASSLVKGWIHA
ncbi:MAG: CrcB family protein [Planctomycetota bacterium]